MADSKNWFTNAIFYRLYLRAFRDGNGDGRGDLRGLIASLDYIENLGVNCIWLMPIFNSDKAEANSGVTDFYGLHPDFGTFSEFEFFVQQAHSRDLKVILDLEMDHTSDQHPWFQASRQNSQSPYRNHYVWSDTDKKFLSTRNFAFQKQGSNWHWDDLTQNFYWSRFASSLPELNYDSQDVRTEMVKVMRFWIGKGVDGFALSGLPYLFEREGTDCENLPDTHNYLKAVRAFFKQNYPDCLLIGNLSQRQKNVYPYFADGNELQINTRTSLAAQILLALHDQDATMLKRYLDQSPSLAENCQWGCHLSSPDGLSIESLQPEEQEIVFEAYSHIPHIENDTIIRRRLAPMLKNDQRKVRLLNALTFSLPGTPIIYYGDEIGMGDKPDWARSVGINVPMQWDETKGTGFSSAPPDQFYIPLVEIPPYDHRHLNVVEQESNPDSLLNFMKDLIASRRDHFELAAGTLEWVETDNSSVVAFIRRAEEKAIFTVFNLSDLTSGARIPREIRQESRLDLLGGYLRLQPDLTNLTLKPYQFAWFAL